MNEKNIQGIYFYPKIQNHINGHLSESYNCLYKIEKKYRYCDYDWFLKQHKDIFFHIKFK